MDEIGTQTREIAEFKVGTLIAGRYEICDHLGFGAMGLVLKVKDRALDDDLLALKILYPHLMADEITFSRFRNEVLVARKLTHPNIVRTYDIGRDQRGHYYISMEYIEGRTLDALIYDEAHPMNFSEIVRILHDTAKGLFHAHEQGVVHRDLKPQNIMIAADGTVKIADFGLAETLWMKKNLTRTGESVGTPYYMAPEQIQSEELDHRCDMYAFGIMAYEMVVHERPFNDDNWFKMAAQHILEPLPEIITEDTNIPEWYPILVQTCAAKKRDDRFQTMGDVISVLAPVVGDGSGNSDFKPMASVIRQKTEASPIVAASKGMIWAGTAALSIMLVLMLLFMAFPRDTQVKVALSLQHSGISANVFKKLFGIDADNSPEFFFRSVAAGDVANVVSFLEQNPGFDINQRDGDGDTALLIAVKTENLPVTRVLFDNPNTKVAHVDSSGRTPLIWAIVNERPDLVDILLSRGKNGVDINALEDIVHGGRSALHYAVVSGNLNIIEKLLQNDANINEKDGAGNTPLILGIQGGKDAVVRALLAKNADKLLTNNAGMDALEVARENLPKESPIIALLNGPAPNAHSATRNQESTNASKISVKEEPANGFTSLETGRIGSGPWENGYKTLSVDVTNKGSTVANGVTLNFIDASNNRYVGTGPSQIGAGQKVAFRRRISKEEASRRYVDVLLQCDNCK